MFKYTLLFIFLERFGTNKINDSEKNPYFLTDFLLSNNCPSPFVFHTQGGGAASTKNMKCHPSLYFYAAKSNSSFQICQHQRRV